MKKIVFALLPLLALACTSQPGAERERLLEEGWRFTKGDHPGAEAPGFDDAAWQAVTIPHDWAIYGPFDRENDLQEVAVTQNGEHWVSLKTGRSGGLPYMGVGWYRTSFDVKGFDADQRAVTLLFDGAMSEARVWVNGREACFWPNGYNAFHVDVTGLLHADGMGNTLAVRLENQPQSSRWYPGAGLYRNVRLITTDKIHVPVWGTSITTPQADSTRAVVHISTEIAGISGEEVTLLTEIHDPAGRLVGSDRQENPVTPAVAGITVEAPELWSPETPALYTATTTLRSGGRVLDVYTTRFGIRTLSYTTEGGFRLNGQPRKFQGVCLHHDLGPLGAAINTTALRRQLTLLKEMGCDAIRTSHNMPCPEQIELCDELGLMSMVEAFDEWDVAKCNNGYHRFFAEWAEKDLVNMVRRFRNNPSVVMWSIGNEVPTQRSPDGIATAEYLQGIVHREDPTRPVTCGMDQVTAVLENGFAAAIDIPGLNYNTRNYEKAHATLPEKLILGSETASTVSSRGVYKFPVEIQPRPAHEDHQCSSYDVESTHWANIPDVDFALADDHSWTIGQFVWTGFDYLGEPSPYDKDCWPSHSSLFGIVDLAGIPKDRYWLYRSLWNRNEPTLHMLPHWTWPGREGEITPVFVYTSYPEAELFVNGQSQGRRTFRQDSTLMARYRLMWNDVVYQPGEIHVVAYDASGAQADEKIIRTAGEPARIVLAPERETIAADGRDLGYVRVSVVDAQGTLCPGYNELIAFEVTGAGTYRAAANGDATCLDLFHLPQMHAFNGELTAIVQAGRKGGKATLKARAPGLPAAEVTFAVK